MKLDNNLVVLDTETLGLRLDQDVWEVALAIGEGPIESFIIDHNLRNADMQALSMNGYRIRVGTYSGPNMLTATYDLLLRELLRGKTIIGANPAFDAYRLERRWGEAPWHYRLIDVESMAIPILDLDKPLGLKGLVDKLNEMGYTIPENDHSASGDVKATREVYRVLRDIGKRVRSI